MSIEVVVNKLIAAIEQRNASAVGELFTDDIVFENVPEGSVIQGRAAAQAKFAEFFAKASQIRWNVKRKIYSDNIAVLERKNHITFLDKNIILPMVTILEVKNNQISLFREYFDTQTFVKQLES